MPATIAFVVAIAGIIFPAISERGWRQQASSEMGHIVLPLISQRVLRDMPYAADRRFEAAVTKSRVSSSSLSNAIVSSPACRRAARRWVL